MSDKLELTPTDIIYLTQINERSLIEDKKEKTMGTLSKWVADRYEELAKHGTPNKMTIINLLANNHNVKLDPIEEPMVIKKASEMIKDTDLEALIEQQEKNEAIDAYTKRKEIAEKTIKQTKIAIAELVEEDDIEEELGPITPWVPLETQVTVPLDSFGIPSKEAITAYIDHYNYLKNALITPNDMMVIEGKDFMKKSGWFKFSEGFMLSRGEPLEKKTWHDDKGAFHAYYRIKVSMPNGRYSVDEGMCSSTERGQSLNNLHNIITKALTRATIRAISFLVGKGEVSAEEIQ